MAIPQVKLTNKTTDVETLLPVYFSYKLPSPKKRFSQKETCGGTLIQESSQCAVTSGALIAFTINACPVDYKELYDLYMSCEEGGGSTIYKFEGYWGESYDVKFQSLDEPTIKGRNFSVSGAFVILCVNTEPNPTNEMQTS